MDELNINLLDNNYPIDELLFKTLLDNSFKMSLYNNKLFACKDMICLHFSGKEQVTIQYGINSNINLPNSLEFLSQFITILHKNNYNRITKCVKLLRYLGFNNG